jgi:hypothetical protein
MPITTRSGRTVSRPDTYSPAALTRQPKGGGVQKPPPRKSPAKKPSATKKASKPRTYRPRNPSSGPTHQQLNAIIRKSFGALPISTGTVTPLSDDPLHRFFFPDSVMKSDAFGRKWRDAYKYMDEFVSTSSIREFINSYLENQPKKQSARKNARTLFYNISLAARMPTELVGFADSKGTMQHPTRQDRAVFADWTTTVSEHNRLDLQRKRVGVAAAELEIKNNPNATLETVLRAFAVAAGIFTLNEMAMSVTSGDNEPNLLRKPSKTDLNKRIEANRARERVKRYLISQGAPQAPDLGQETGEQRINRFTRRGTGAADVSQDRLDAFGNLLPDPPAHPLASPASPASHATAGSNPLATHPTTTTTTTTAVATHHPPADQFDQAQRRQPRAAATKARAGFAKL